MDGDFVRYHSFENYGFIRKTRSVNFLHETLFHERSNQVKGKLANVERMSGLIIWLVVRQVRLDVMVKHCTALVGFSMGGVMIAVFLIGNNKLPYEIRLDDLWKLHFMVK